LKKRPVDQLDGDAPGLRVARRQSDSKTAGSSDRDPIGNRKNSPRESVIISPSDRVTPGSKVKIVGRHAQRMDKLRNFFVQIIASTEIEATYDPIVYHAEERGGELSFSGLSLLRRYSYLGWV
jgi:hypothetical protein